MLLRTEKKVLRAQLRLLTKLVKTHPECAAQVSTLVADAANTLPLDVQSTARKLIIDEPVTTAPNTPDTEARREALLFPRRPRVTVNQGGKRNRLPLSRMTLNA